MDIFVHSANKGAPLGSSQVNGAPNNTIGSKAPKIQHYGSSESNDYRVACPVCPFSTSKIGFLRVKTNLHFTFTNCSLVNKNSDH